MKQVRRNTEILGAFVVILNACLAVFADICPDPDVTAPCVCYNSPLSVLECTGIKEDEILSLFQRLKGFTFREFHLKFSTLKYLPKEMFEKAIVEELYIQNSTLNALFDSPPEGLQNLNKLHLENTKITEISHWEILKPLTNLKVLAIYYNHIESIDAKFAEYVTHDLEQIIFYATGTKRIESGALTKFTKLDRIGVDACPLKTITRDVFPTPSVIRHIYFNDNEISTIPNDLFTDMPNLQTIGLRNNLLTTLPEAAFGGNIRKLKYLFLENNPVKCDCSLVWLIQNQPEYLGGYCATPIRVHDKALRDLELRDFKC